MLQLFQHYFGITDKSRENRIFHRFFEFSPWSRNNNVMIPMTWYFPANLSPKNYTSKLNFEKKKFLIPKGVSGSVSKSEYDHFGMSDGIFFFLLKKKLIIVFFWGQVYRRLPQCCNYPNLMSGSQTKVEKTEIFIVFSNFHRDPEIIM